jgi:hypothetical protein
MMMWSSLLHRTPQEDPKEIYFVFFKILFYFLWILGNLYEILEI